MCLSGLRRNEILALEGVRIWMIMHVSMKNGIGTLKTVNTEGLLSLYAEDAVFESPLVPAIIPGAGGGVLRGREAIKHFLEEGTQRRPNELVRWYRTGEYLTNGKTLVWEYPRETPEGEQIDILELMEISDGLIVNHRVYWGWKGCQHISEALVRNK